MKKTDCERLLHNLFQDMINRGQMPMDMDAVRASRLVEEVAALFSDDAGAGAGGEQPAATGSLATKKRQGASQ